MDRVAIIGLGPIGLSIGLALKRAGLKNTEVVGVSGDRGALAAASRMGAVDRATGNLWEALDGCQLVIVDTPLSEMERLLEAIGPVLADGCVVTDTGSAKVQVMEWAESYLGNGSSFVGGRPLPNRTVTRAEDADASLFDGTYYGVIAPASADPESVKSVVGLAETLGAEPLFLDAHENDSYTAALEHLPLLLSFAMVSAASHSPSWADMSRLAGAAFRQLAELAVADPRDSASLSLANRKPLTQWIDRLIAELSSYRKLLQEDGEGLADTFIEAWEARARWEAGTPAEESGVDVPSSSQNMAGLFVGRHLAERYRQITGAGRQPPSVYTKKRK